MNSILAKIEELITEPMKNLDIVVDSVTWEVEGKYNYLKIVLDREIPLDIDTIVEATHIINPILDELRDYIDAQTISIEEDIISGEVENPTGEEIVDADIASQMNLARSSALSR